MSTLRGCPPRWVCGGGISGAKIPHCASVRSEGYRFRDRPSVAKCVYSFTGEACANCLPNQAFCQGQFPESLSLLLPCYTGKKEPTGRQSLYAVDASCHQTLLSLGLYSLTALLVSGPT